MMYHHHPKIFNSRTHLRIMTTNIRKMKSPFLFLIVRLLPLLLRTSSTTWAQDWDFDRTITKWNYNPTAKIGPDNWARAKTGDPIFNVITDLGNNQCESGKQQSPVDLIPHEKTISRIM